MKKTIKKLFLLCLFSMISIGASAYDFEVDGIYYKIISSTDLTCAVTYEKYENYTSISYKGIVNIPASVSYNEKTYSVTSIGYSAFRGCTGLSYVVIPNSVTSIGDHAFLLCTGLTSVTIPNSVTSIGGSAFYCCSGLASVTIPNSVTSIGSYAFSDCTGLTSITIPNSVTSIRDGVFYGCSGLTSITIPNSVTSIGYSAFEMCSGLTSIEIPNSVTSIGGRAFRGCTSLTSIEIPNSVTSIGDVAFEGCSGLTSIEIPNSVTSIGEYAFRDCSGLKSVTIGNSVTSIGYRAFEMCSGLTSIVVESDNAKYDSRENCNALIETATNTLIAGCMNTIIPNSVTSIGEYAFRDCSGLTSIEIPNSVTSIGYHAFYGSGLTSVTIPNSVTSIEDRAFYECSALTLVTNLATTPQKINESTFPKYVTLHVLKGYKDAYAKADYWKNFTINDDVEPVKVTSVNIDKDIYYCLLNEIGQATATVKPDDALDKTVIWSCSDPSKLFIDANTGQFIGLAVGEVTITATANDGSGVSGQAIVVVQDPSGIEEVEASPKSSPEGKDLYNLQGQKVSVNGFSGVVMKNGKKYVVK